MSVGGAPVAHAATTSPPITISVPSMALACSSMRRARIASDRRRREREREDDRERVLHEQNSATIGTCVASSPKVPTLQRKTIAQRTAPRATWTSWRPAAITPTAASAMAVVPTRRQSLSATPGLKAKSADRQAHE
jgi:hypothetical protein